MQFKKVIECDVCHEPIIMPKCRIEYNQGGFMHVCHKKCSFGMNNPRIVIADFDLDAEGETANSVMKHLAEINRVYPNCGEGCTRIIYKIFK